MLIVAHLAQSGASAAPQPLVPAQAIPKQAATVRVTITSSIEAALTAAAGHWGRPLAAEAARLLRWRGRLNTLVRPHDELALMYAPPEPGGTEANPTLLALRYRGAQLTLDAYRFAGADGIFRYYDEAGELIEPHMVHAPVPQYEQITEVVQRGRGLRNHRGVDLKAKQGAAVVLPFAGTVRRLNWSRRHNGRCVEVLLDAGYLAHFLHLHEVSPALKVGAYLKAGTPLGTVGNTGRSSGPHLHYELLRNNQPIEPLLVHGRRTVRLGPEALKAFVPQRDAMALSLGISP
jgi:murein DD-endopeptidase